MRFYLFESYNKNIQKPLRILRSIPTEYNNDWKTARGKSHLIKKKAQSPDHLIFMGDVLIDLKDKIKNGDYLKKTLKDKDGNIIDDRTEEELKRIAEIGSNFYDKKEIEKRKKKEKIKNELE